MLAPLVGCRELLDQTGLPKAAARQVLERSRIETLPRCLLLD
jgi:hypothetical protein